MNTSTDEQLRNVSEDDLRLIARELDRLSYNQAAIGYRILQAVIDENIPGSLPTKFDPKGIQQAKDFFRETYNYSTELLDGVSDICVAIIVNTSKSIKPLVQVPTDLTDKSRPQVEIIKEHERSVLMGFPGIARNVFTGETVCLNAAGEYQTLPPEAMRVPHLYIADKANLFVPKDMAKDMVLMLSSQSPFNPARNALLACSKSHDLSIEEAKEIIFSIPETYMNNDEEVANQVFGYFLVCAARLHLGIEDALPPEFVPILGGEQGCYKSSFIEVLFNYVKDRSMWSVVTSSPEKFFSDITLRSTAACMEFPEIENWLNLKNLNAFKAAVTDAFPEGRRPYDTAPTKTKRMSVWVGTTNNADSVLIDRTSSYDRRFIPIRIPNGTFIDTESAARDTSRIWAAAVKLVEENVIHRPHALPKSVYANLSEYQDGFFDECPLQEGALAYARGSNFVYPPDTMLHVFGQRPEEIDPAQLKTIKAIYKKYLPMMGFEWKRQRVDGSQVRMWVRKEPMSSEDLSNIQHEINSSRGNKLITFSSSDSDF